MIRPSIIASVIAAIALGFPAKAASITGVINFSSAGGGGVVLQDAGALATTNMSAAFGIQSWLLPQVDTRSGSFVSVPQGAPVTMTLSWIFNPSTPVNPLWLIPGPDNFAFQLASATIEFQNASFLLISGTGTLTRNGIDATPATWEFTTQGVATEGKFSWSSTTTAIPELGTPALFCATMLGACILRRRNPAQPPPNNNDHETNISPRDVLDGLDGPDIGEPS
jgi:hypothetical protein